jgi:hypothetical protein
VSSPRVEQRAREIGAAIESEQKSQRKADVAFADVMFRVRKLRVVDGEFLAISHDEPNFGQANALANGIGQQLQNAGKTGVIILVIGPGLTVETFDETAMAKAGWVRMSPELRDAEAAFREMNGVVDIAKFRADMKAQSAAMREATHVRVIRKNPAIVEHEPGEPVLVGIGSESISFEPDPE